jgi:hypothetical protein
MGDEDDADSHMTYDQLPVILNDIVVGAEVFYPTTKQLRATITSAGTAGKWMVIPRVTELGAL